MAVTEELKENTTSATHSFTFPYMKKSDIKVSIKDNTGTVTELAQDNNGYSVGTTDIELLGTTKTTVAASAHDVRIYRLTSDADLAATFYPGSAIRSADLNDNFTQNLYTTQEVVARYFDATGLVPLKGDIDCGGYQLKSAGKITAVELDISSDVSIDGNATFASTIVSGADPNATVGNIGQRMDPSSGIIARSAGSNQLWTGYQTGSGDVTSEIKATGAATFNGSVQSGGYPYEGAANGSALMSGSGCLASYETAASFLWRGYTTGTSDPTSSINAGGDATFASTTVSGAATFGGGTTEISHDGNVQVDGSINTGGSVAAGSNGILLDGGGYIQATRSNSSYKLWIGQLSGTNTSEITAAGAATFAATNLEIDSTGQLTIKKAASYTDPSFRILDRNNSNEDGVLMYGDGTATFAGNVGIGITDGDSTLDVKSSITSKCRFRDSNGSNETGMYFEADNTSARIGSTYHASSGGAFKPLEFMTSGTAKMSITAGGNVGIGTSDPEQYLHIYSTIAGGAALELSENVAGTQYNGLIQMFGNDMEIRGSAGNIEFYTGNNDGSSSTERMRILADGNVGIGTELTDDFGAGHRVVQVHSTTTANAYLSLTNTTTGDQGAANGLNLIQVGNNSTFLNRSDGFMSFGTDGNERMQLHSDGYLLVNTTASRVVEDNVGNGPQGKIQIEATNSDALMSIISAGTSDANRCGTLSLGRHRNSTIGGTPTLVQNNDALGAICFAGGDDSDMRTKGAQIVCQVDGDPDGDDMPGRLVFSTTSDGLHYPQERMRISSTGAATFTSTISCTSLTETSDIALKTDIEPITNVLDKLQQITGYTYKFKDDGRNSMGVTAQDVEKVFPELVHGEDGAKSLQYSGLIGALIESVKELSNKVAALEAS